MTDQRFLALAALLALATGSSALAAAPVVDRVESAVFETSGDHQAITRRGATCIAQVVKPGVVNAPTILNTDPEGGVVVANNAFEYVDRFIIPTTEQARTTLTFEAKDGRFRVVHSSIERFFKPGGWGPVGSGALVPTTSLSARLAEISNGIAECVKRPVSDF